MNKAQQLYAQYEKDLAELQGTCPHEILTEVFDVIGSGSRVQFCETCDKTINEKYRCWNCFTYYPSDGGFESDGREEYDGTRLAYGGCWCSQACAVEATKRGKEMGYASFSPRNDSCRHCHIIFPRSDKCFRGYVGLCSDECAKLYLGHAE